MRFDLISPIIYEELLFKEFVYFRSGSRLVHWSKPVSTILVERHLGNMPVKFDFFN